jgi:hypothetical protein
MKTVGAVAVPQNLGLSKIDRYRSCQFRQLWKVQSQFSIPGSMRPVVFVRKPLSMKYQSVGYNADMPIMAAAGNK